jgi:hypothetical protein
MKTKYGINFKIKNDFGFWFLMPSIAIYKPSNYVCGKRNVIACQFGIISISMGFIIFERY